MTGSTREGCYVCSKKNSKKDKTFLQHEIDKKYPGEYVIIDDYINSRTPILVKRVPCNHTYKISPDNLLRGKGCPRCTIKQSHYMDIVEKYFDSHGIKYEKEKRFSDCRNIRTLPFDYYIKEKNTCIEVDGEFHFPRRTMSLSQRSSYEEVCKRDSIKTEYCSTHNINLIRLPYYEENNFCDILDQRLYANTEITSPI